MASRSELVRQYMGYQQNQQTDEMLAMLADDVKITFAARHSYAPWLPWLSR